MPMLSRMVPSPIAGVIAGRIVKRVTGGVITDVLPDVAGAVIAERLLRLFRMPQVNKLDFYDARIAAAGAVPALIVHRAMFHRPRNEFAGFARGL